MKAESIERIALRVKANDARVEMRVQERVKRSIDDNRRCPLREGRAVAVDLYDEVVDLQRRPSSAASEQDGDSLDRVRLCDEGERSDLSERKKAVDPRRGSTLNQKGIRRKDGSSHVSPDSFHQSAEVGQTGSEGETGAHLRIEQPPKSLQPNDLNVLVQDFGCDLEERPVNSTTGGERGGAGEREDLSNELDREGCRGRGTSKEAREEKHVVAPL